MTKTTKPMPDKKTKKDKILKMFNSAEWVDGVKYLGYNLFLDAGLSPNIEYGDTYCDVIYARMILKKMGYKVLQGAYCIYVHKVDRLKNYRRIVSR